MSVHSLKAVNKIEPAQRSVSDLVTNYFEALFKRYNTPEDFRVATLAKQLNFSKRTFQRLLQNEGLTFADLLDSARKKHAEELIFDESLSVEEISKLLGFIDRSGYLRSHKKWFGIPPRKYRTDFCIRAR